MKSSRFFQYLPGPSRVTQATVVTLAIGALWLMPDAARATITGPYTNDVNTLHLWHLDETVTPCIDSGNSATNLTSLQSGATLGNAAYIGFGNALSTYDGGPTGTAQGARDAIFSCRGSNSPVIFTYANPVTRAFTFEAIVRIDFDPFQSEATVANGGTGRNSLMHIMTCESGAGQRIFQWRINPVGVAIAPAPALEFVNVTLATPNISVQIPTNGPDAIASNQWYHVAVSFTGTGNTANNLKFYWTLLDPSRTAANLISSTNMTAALPPAFGTTNTVFTLGNIGRPTAGGNFVGLIDEVRMSSVERSAVGMMFTSSALSFVVQPQNQFAVAGETVSLSAVVGGESPRYQWLHSSTNLPGATNAALVLSNIVASQAGPYQLIATNSTTTTNSVIVNVTVGNFFAEVFNTGVDASRALLPGTVVDPHWQLVQSDDPNSPGPAAYVNSAPAGTWLVNGPSSKWISPSASSTAASGTYTYRTSFLLDTVDPTNAQLAGSWATDNGGVDVRINGTSLGYTIAPNGFASFSFFTITNGLVAGSNSLDLVVTNTVSGGVNLSGLRAELRGIGLPLPPTAPYLTGSPGNVTTQSQQTATFTVTAAGSAPLTYQWYHGVTALPAQTNRTLTLAGLAGADAGAYTVYVTNTVGWTNATATLTVITPAALEWLGIDAVNPSFWDTASTNWLDTGAVANVVFSPYADVIFDDAGSAQPSVSLVGALNPNSILANAATTSYTLTGAGSITGTTSLTKTNAGTLVLDTANTYSGNTLIQGGTLQVGNGDASGTLGRSTVSNSASLVFNRTDTFNVPNVISGTGTVTMAGSGVLVLAGPNTYTGPTIISSGTINANSAAALGTADGGTTVASGGQLLVDAAVNLGAEPLTLSGSGPAGNGALRKAAGAGTIIGSPITLAADAMISVDAAQTVTMTNAAGITAPNLNLTLLASGANSRGTVNGPITLGLGALTENGPGTWVLVATNNNWSGGTTTTSAGTLQVGDGGANGSLGGGAVVNGGTLSFLTALSLTITNPIQNDGTMTFNSTGNLLVSGTIAGAGPINQNGADTVTLTGTNASYSGTTTLRATSVLRPGNSQALGTGTCTIGTAQTDTSRLELLGGLALSNAITIFPRAYNSQNNPANILNVSGTNIVSPPSSIVIPGGGNLLTLQSDSGRLVLAAGVTAGGAGRNLVMKGAAAGEVVGNIDHTGANSVLLWKLDAGAWTLWGNNTPNAATTISNGLLVINGTMDASLITVAGGTLGGTGTLSGPLVVNAGATLAPGSSIGTLTVNNNLTLQVGSITSVELNKTAATCDQVLGLSNVLYGGTLVITNLSGTLVGGEAFKLFDAATYSGSFTALSPTNPPGAGLSWNTNTLAVDGTLRVQGPVTARPVINSVVNAGGNIIFSGTNGSPGTGYSVLSTNNLIIPRTNWPVVGTGTFDGAGHFSYTNAITPGTPQAFFLLRAP